MEALVPNIESRVVTHGVGVLTHGLRTKPGVCASGVWFTGDSSRFFKWGRGQC